MVSSSFLSVDLMHITKLCIGKKSNISSSKMRIHRYPKNVIEVTLSFGATDEMILAAETAINDYYSGVLMTQGEETEEMGEVMERYFGGFWSVGIFDDPYGFSWTIIRRSPAFAMFDVNGKGIVFAKEAVLA
ncbi:hypothetical protein NECAME_10779 [Necator americanus]|uniref:Uncharacterized protein n=1 Tax=Necator americanus TaxID=51031 RepID=W2T875_NECAM|nr:hypothetical protein NECAME_10779 [Necator americanus]ETN77799.1 hypothetical protein NECAME_10779 [Necator americanus]